MTLIYQLIGRLVVRLGFAYVRRRYGRPLLVVGALLVALLVGGGAALAARSGVDEA